jgi:C4-dicarboxylate-specific signal transduction histidine kinase
MFSIFGFESGDPSLKNFVSKIIKEDLAEFEESVLFTVITSWVLIKPALHETVEFRICVGERLRHIRCSGSVECDLDGAPVGVMGYLEDVTSIKEKELEDLLHLSKMAILGKMTAAIVHEINNPLSVLTNYSSFLNDLSPSSLDSEVFSRCVEGISKNSNRIAEIVSSVKFFTGGGPAQSLEVSNLKMILKETFTICQENMKWSSVDFEFTCDEEISLECKPIQISQVLINLICNSVMAISSSEERWIKINAFVHKDVVKILVMDSGNGIPESIAKSMTRPYFTTKKRQEGTGIGLTICKAIAEGHKGRLYYDGTSKNTLFVLELPVTQPLL